MAVSTLAQTFAFMFRKQVTIKPYLGVAGNGARLYGAAKTYWCRVDEDAMPIFTATGQQVVSTAVILIFPRATDGTELAALSADALVTLPDGTTPRILRAGSIPDLAGGTIYWEVRT